MGRPGKRQRARVKSNRARVWSYGSGAGSLWLKLGHKKMAHWLMREVSMRLGPDSHHVCGNRINLKSD